jgi:two-component system NarL family response regulator
VTEPIRVLICDDHELFRRGLLTVLEQEEGMKVVAEAENAEDALEKAAEVVPDVVLMDVRLEVRPTERSGLAATSRIKEIVPSAQVLMLTASDEQADLYDAMKAGAIGYLLKGISAHEIAEAIRSVHSGVSMISPSMASKLVAEFVNVSKQQDEPASATTTLSERELEILKLVAKGQSNREIGDNLGVSENTVKKHVRNILDKVHMRTRVEAALYAVREGLIEDPGGSSAN